MGEKVPVLSAVKPNGSYTINQFEDAGGARGIMKQLEPLLDTNVLTVTGKTLAENLKDAVVHDEDVIRPMDKAFSNKSPIVILRGTLAPESAVVKLGIRDGSRRAQFTGPAIVYDDAEVAIKAIENGDVKPGQVLVIRGMGLKGGPAMAGAASLVVFALDSAGLSTDVAFISDGQLSGLCNKGITVAEVSPESAVGGPLALVQTGDQISIDVDKHILDLDVSEEELAKRREAMGDRELPESTGYLSIYQRTVQPMSTGAVFVKK